MTELEFKRCLRQFERDIKRQAIEEVRRRYREEMHVIYVKEYTVKAHLRRMKPRRVRLRSVA